MRECSPNSVKVDLLAHCPLLYQISALWIARDCPGKSIVRDLPPLGLVFVVRFCLLLQRPRLARKSSGRLQSDPYISSIKTSTKITSSNSLCRERDAPSSDR